MLKKLSNFFMSDLTGEKVGLVGGRHGFIPVYTEGGQVEFSYPIVAGDTDGVFTFELYNIPLWQADVYYNKLINHLVYKDGVIYKVKESNSGENPSMPGSELYWDVYELDESIFTTRYAEKRRKAVTCISLDCCGSGLVVDAFCSNTVSPCGDVSENKAYQQAMKYNVIREAVRIMECKNDYRDWETDRKSTRLNSSHSAKSRMPSSA